MNIKYTADGEEIGWVGEIGGTVLAICDRCGGVMPFLESNQLQAKALGYEQLCNECCAEMVFDLFDLQGDDYKMRHDQVEE